nr:gephyrin-like molybdotransferase Glp [uncultured Holophaga sp.]
MTTVDEARRLILDHAAPLPAVELPLAEAQGMVLAQDLHAVDPLPLFTNSAMDGFALRSADIAPGVRLQVLATVAAGQVADRHVEPGTALRIMTGAPLPEGADTVVPLEHTRHGEDWVEFPKAVKTGANVRHAGEDVRPGDRVMEAGTVILPGAIAVLASLGLTRIPVHPRPRVAVVSSGNELVDASERPGPGQIRDSNGPAICAQVEEAGAIARPFPRVRDAHDAVEATIREAVSTCDVLITTGGVSEGDYDYTKVVLEELGAVKLFWKVSQKPGGPFGVWLLDGKFVFGIPGNPVPAMLMVEEYVRPALRRMMGLKQLLRPETTATLDQDWHRGKPDGKTHMLRVVVHGEPDGLHARLTGAQGSGVITSMLKANALAFMEPECQEAKAGESIRIHLIRHGEDH